MKYVRQIVALILFFSAIDSFCQSNQEVEMADILRQDGKIYTVVFGLVVILTAMIVLLIRMDRKILRLEKEIRKDA